MQFQLNKEAEVISVERLFRYVLTLLITTVAVISLYQVIMRYVFQIPVMGLEEILVYPTVWLYFLGSVNASREDTQIKANVLDVFLKTNRSKMIVRVIADVMSLVVSAWLTYWAWGYFKYAFRIWKESPTLYIPTFYAEASVFIGLLLMTIYTAYYLIKNSKKLAGSSET